MKTFYFNIQSKGGSGKSILTYLQALQQEENEKALFVDVDSSSRTSAKQLAFLRPQKRVVELNLNDHLKRIDREKILSELECFSQMEMFDSYYLDMGAAESQQLFSLIRFNLNPDELKEFEESMISKFVFNIILAGGGYYLSCLDFANNLIEALEGKFTVNLYVNQFTFQSNQELIEELNGFYNDRKDIISGLKLYGDIYIEFESGKKILKFVRDGIGIKGYNDHFISKLKIRREIAKV